MFDSPDYFPQVFSKILNNCVYKLILCFHSSEESCRPQECRQEAIGTQETQVSHQSQGTEEEEEGREEIHRWLHTPCWGQHYGCSQLCKFIACGAVCEIFACGKLCVCKLFSLHVANLVIQIVDVVMFAIKIFRCDQFCFLYVTHS